MCEHDLPREEAALEAVCAAALEGPGAVDVLGAGDGAKTGESHTTWAKTEGTESMSPMLGISLNVLVLSTAALHISCARSKSNFAVISCYLACSAEFTGSVQCIKFPLFYRYIKNLIWMQGLRNNCAEENKTVAFLRVGMVEAKPGVQWAQDNSSSLGSQLPLGHLDIENSSRLLLWLPLLRGMNPKWVRLCTAAGVRACGAILFLGLSHIPR